MFFFLWVAWVGVCVVLFGGLVSCLIGGSVVCRGVRVVVVISVVLRLLLFWCCCVLVVCFFMGGCWCVWVGFGFCVKILIRLVVSAPVISVIVPIRRGKRGD